MAKTPTLNPLQVTDAMQAYNSVRDTIDAWERSTSDMHYVLESLHIAYSKFAGSSKQAKDRDALVASVEELVTLHSLPGKPRYDALGRVIASKSSGSAKMTPWLASTVFAALTDNKFGCHPLHMAHNVLTSMIREAKTKSDAKFLDKLCRIALSHPDEKDVLPQLIFVVDDAIGEENRKRIMGEISGKVVTTETNLNALVSGK